MARTVCNKEFVTSLINKGHNPEIANAAFVWSQTPQKHAWWLEAFAKAEANDNQFDEETLAALQALVDEQELIDNPPAPEGEEIATAPAPQPEDTVEEPVLDEVTTDKAAFKNKRR